MPKFRNNTAQTLSFRYGGKLVEVRPGETTDELDPRDPRVKAALGQQSLGEEEDQKPQQPEPRSWNQ
jgi:hypothetical protein